MFIDAAVPNNLRILLRQAFAVRSSRGRTTVELLARVLAKYERNGLEAAAEELSSMGVPTTPPKPKSH